jgi:hypothetical protein
LLPSTTHPCEALEFWILRANFENRQSAVSQRHFDLYQLGGIKLFRRYLVHAFDSRDLEWFARTKIEDRSIGVLL